MSVSHIFYKEAVGDDDSFGESSINDQVEDDVIHDDFEGDKREVNTLANKDDFVVDNIKVFKTIADAAIEGLQPIIPAYQSIIRECV